MRSGPFEPFTLFHIRLGLCYELSDSSWKAPVRRRTVLTITFIVGLYCAASATQTPPLVITHITIIDTHGGPPQPDMAVIIRGNRIAEVQRANRDDWNGATVLDGRGKFLIPGLWDMEVHLSWTTDSVLPLLIAKRRYRCPRHGQQSTRARKVAYTNFDGCGGRTLHIPSRSHAEWEELQSVPDGDWVARTGERDCSHPEIHRDGCTQP